MKTLNFLLFLLFLVFVMSCKKDTPVEPESDLPPLTTTGEGTFGCYLNGEPWVAEWYLTAPGTFEYLESSYSLSSGRFGIEATLRGDGTLNQVLSLGYAVPQNGNFSTYPEFKTNIRDFNKNLGCYRYKLDTLSQFQSEIIEFDIDNQIASGTFSANIIGEDCLDTIKITDGRFDVQFNVIP